MERCWQLISPCLASLESHPLPKPIRGLPELVVEMLGNHDSCSASLTRPSLDRFCSALDVLHTSSLTSMLLSHPSVLCAAGSFSQANDHRVTGWQRWQETSGMCLWLVLMTRVIPPQGWNFAHL